MEKVKVKGIVIGDTNYSESSKILNVFTKEYGIIGIISKGYAEIININYKRKNTHYFHKRKIKSQKLSI